MKTDTTNNSKIRILLVEDDAPTRESAGIKLAKEGFTVETAENGFVAFEKIQRDSNFRAILLDLRMPKSDGFEFLEKKKAHPELQNIPVIVFTNLNQPENIERAVSLGAKGYLVKAHHSIQEIANELKNCLVHGTCIIDN